MLLIRLGMPEYLFLLAWDSERWGMTPGLRAPVRSNPATRLLARAMRLCTRVETREVCS